MGTSSKKIKSFISGRVSPYAFSEESISEEDIMTLFGAARLAPSSFNEQPWRFVYAKKDSEEEFNKLLSILMEGNREWAKHAPLVGISIAKLNFSYNGNPNRFAIHDVGLAMGGLLAQATSMGIKVHQMGGYYLDKASDVLDLPRGYEPVAMFVMGYQGNPDDLTEDIKRKELREHSRRPLNELVSMGDFKFEG